MLGDLVQLAEPVRVGQRLAPLAQVGTLNVLGEPDPAVAAAQDVGLPRRRGDRGGNLVRDRVQDRRLLAGDGEFARAALGRLGERLRMQDPMRGVDRSGVGEDGPGLGFAEQSAPGVTEASR